MKTNLFSIPRVFAALLLISAPALAEVRILNHGGAFLPREDSDLSHQGDSWNGAVSNWMTLLRTQSATPVGTGRQQAVREHDLGDYRNMITSSLYNLWRGTPEDYPPAPTKEWGNRWHHAIQVVATGGDTFRPQDVTYRYRTFVLDGSGNYVSAGTDITIAFNQLNAYRQVLTNGSDGIPGTGDDQVNGTQNPSSQVTNFLFAGSGVGLSISTPSETPLAQRIQNVTNSRWDQDYKIVFDITVPYTPAGGGSAQTTLQFEVGKKKAVIEDNGEGDLVVTGTVSGRVYTVEHSATLADWQPLVTFFGEDAPYVIPMPHKADTNANPKHFYRIGY